VVQQRVVRRSAGGGRVLSLHSSQAVPSHATRSTVSGLNALLNLLDERWPEERHTRTPAAARSDARTAGMAPGAESASRREAQGTVSAATVGASANPVTFPEVVDRLNRDLTRVLAMPSTARPLPAPEALGRLGDLLIRLYPEQAEQAEQVQQPVPRQASPIPPVRSLPPRGRQQRVTAGRSPQPAAAAIPVLLRPASDVQAGRGGEFLRAPVSLNPMQLEALGRSMTLSVGTAGDPPVSAAAPSPATLPALLAPTGSPIHAWHSSLLPEPDTPSMQLGPGEAITEGTTGAPAARATEQAAAEGGSAPPPRASTARELVFDAVQAAEVEDEDGLPPASTPGPGRARHSQPGAAERAGNIGGQGTAGAVDRGRSGAQEGSMRPRWVI
jgi:hypothetical protein